MASKLGRSALLARYRELIRQNISAPTLIAYGVAASLSYSVCTTIHAVDGSSMAPALSPQYHVTRGTDYVFAPFLSLKRRENGPWARACIQDLERGDVVWMKKPHNPEQRTIKRVLALPGDEVIPDRRRQQNNIRFAAKQGFGEVPSRLIIPAGHIWVEGDNWRDSFDSKDLGTIPINMVEGRAVSIVWPPSRWGKIEDRERSNQWTSKTKVRPQVQQANSETDWEQVVYS